MKEEALFFDKGLRGSIENIVVSEGPFFRDLQWRLASLPIRLGGLGLRAGISDKKKTPVNFLTDPSEEKSTLRPIDVLVFGWVRGKHACVDLTGVSPLVGLRCWGFTMGQDALKAASCKVTKHEKACIENQHVFIPFAFDTLGFLAPEAMELLNSKVINSVKRGVAA
ncbi:hypothetical protein Tco_0590579 [Tanacetum coccineum]